MLQVAISVCQLRVSQLVQQLLSQLGLLFFSVGAAVV
jgi:hypothetical protein